MKFYIFRTASLSVIRSVYSEIVLMTDREAVRNM